MWDARARLYGRFREVLENRALALHLLWRAALDLIPEPDPAAFSLDRRIAVLNLLPVIGRISEAYENLAF